MKVISMGRRASALDMELEQIRARFQEIYAAPGTIDDNTPSFKGY